LFLAIAFIIFVQIYPEMRIGLLIYTSFLLLSSCATQDVCDGDNQSKLVAQFKTIESDVISDTIISGVTIYGIREGKTDSLLYDSSSTSSILLPLDPNHDFTRFVLNVNDHSDTLRFLYRTEYYLISYTCGFAALFNLDSVRYSHMIINDMEIINSVIDAEQEENEEHLWIYF
jgi:hypothetical protein